MAELSQVQVGTTTYDLKDSTARTSVASLSNQIANQQTALSNETSRAQAAEGKLECLVVNCGTISSLPTTVNNTNVESDMVVLQHTLGTPSAQISDWNIDTANESVTISGSISGSTTLTLYLMKSR